MNIQRTASSVIAALLILSIGFSVVSADDESWTSGDKFVHAGVAGGVSFVSYNVYKKTTKMNTVTAKLAAFATAVAAGALKEAIDGEFSEKDFFADIIGGGIGAAVAFEF